MTDGRWETQVAVYDALRAADIAGGRIFAPVPPNYRPEDAGAADDVYVGIADGGSVEDDFEGMAGTEDRLILDVWQLAQSLKDVRATISAIRTALHAQTLTVSGETSAWCRVRSDRVDRDPDGLHVHGVVELIIIHQKDQ